MSSNSFTSPLSLAFLSLLFLSHITLANVPEDMGGGGLSNDKCAPITQTRALNAGQMGSATSFLLKSISDNYKKETKKDLKVVIIARAGTDPEKTKILKDYNESGRALSLKDISKAVESHFHSAFSSHEISKEAKRDYMLSLFEDRNNKRHLRYSHLGFAVNTHNPDPGKSWKIYHLLKPCEKSRPVVHKGGLGWFFADKPYDYSTLITVLPHDIQERVFNIVTSPEKSSNFMAETYRLASTYRNSDSLNYQNSTTWPLEVLAASISSIELKSRKEAVAYLKETGYLPTKLAISGMHATGAALGWGGFTRWTLPEYLKVTSKEHPYAAGPLAIVEGHTVLSVDEYLDRQLGSHIKRYEFRLPDELRLSEPKISEPSSHQPI